MKRFGSISPLPFPSATLILICVADQLFDLEHWGLYRLEHLSISLLLASAYVPSLHETSFIVHAFTECFPVDALRHTRSCCVLSVVIHFFRLTITSRVFVLSRRSGLETWIAPNVVNLPSEWISP